MQPVISTWVGAYTIITPQYSIITPSLSTQSLHLVSIFFSSKRLEIKNGTDTSNQERALRVGCGFLDSQGFNPVPSAGTERVVRNYILKDGIPWTISIAYDTKDGETIMKVVTRIKYLLQNHDPLFKFTNMPDIRPLEVKGFGKRAPRTSPIPKAILKGGMDIIQSKMKFEGWIIQEGTQIKYTLVILSMPQGFAEFYELYVADPDEGVEFDANDIFEDIPEGLDKYTDHETIIICGLILLSLNKNWVSDTHFNIFVVSRTKAMKNMLNAEAVSMDMITKLVTINVSKAVAGTLQFYPKLKSVIFLYILHYNSQLNVHLRMLLE